ncbi:hypothetical protein ACGFX4_07125 [Kitasatospora sp. NPDC048365]|uniref:hypothetical protein n=1 Tax=Kitasatospora sp. NPDC048365 TaxID=3364050 RepID=UPI00372472D5
MTIRTFAGAAALAAAPLFLLPTTAHAAPGDNGDVKIHDSTTPEDDERNDPKVCSFYLDGFNFDTVQQVSWTISQQPPTGNAQVLAGNITLVTGHGRTADYSLPDGHYKLDWTFAGENGSAKHKVFMVSCASPSASPSTSSSPSASASTSTSATPTKRPPTSPSPSSTTPGGGNGPSATPRGGVGAGGGGSVEELSVPEVVGGAALIAGAAGAGFWALRRNRRRDAH